MAHIGIEARPTFLAANLLSRKNESRARPCTKEDVIQRCNERIKLCEILQEIDPLNQTWDYASKFFNTFPKGRDAILQLSQKWGVIRNGRNSIAPPEGLEDAYPREFIDLDEETILSLNKGKTDIDTQNLAEKARRSSLTQYENLKSGLLNAGVPLLCRDYIKTMHEILPEAPLCLIGLSEDEAQTYNSLRGGKKKPPLIGVNKGFSPGIERMIQEGEIIEINDNHIKTSDLQRGVIYATRADITKKGLPISRNEFKIGLLYVWHHIPKDDKEDFLEMLMKHSIKSPDGGIALGIFEPHNNINLYRMVLETNSYLGHETAAFDALIGTTACGGQSREGFRQEISNLSGRDNWRSCTFPNLPPLPLFQSKILPTQQVAVLGWK